MMDVGERDELRYTAHYINDRTNSVYKDVAHIGRLWDWIIIYYQVHVIKMFYLENCSCLVLKWGTIGGDGLVCALREGRYLTCGKMLLPV